MMYDYKLNLKARTPLACLWEQSVEQKKLIILCDGTPKKCFRHDEQEIALAEMEKLAEEEEDGIFELAIYIADEFIETVYEIIYDM